MRFSTFRKTISAGLVVTLLAGMLPAWTGKSRASEAAGQETAMKLLAGLAGSVASAGAMTLSTPTAPQKGSWVSPAYNEVTLKWDGLPENVTYAVYRNGTFAGNSALPEFTDTGLPERSAVKYDIHTVSADGAISVPLAVYAGTSSKGESLVTATPQGLPSQGYIHETALSGDGWTSAFVSKATDLIPGTGDSDYGFLYIRNLKDNSIRAGLPAGSPEIRDIRGLALSKDGRFLAFSGDDPTGRSDAFLLDLTAQALTNLTAMGNGDSFTASISERGDKLLVQSRATNLPGAPVNPGRTPNKIFLYDRISGVFTYIPLDDSVHGYWPTSLKISGDGTQMVFTMRPMDGGDSYSYAYSFEKKAFQLIGINIDDPSLSRDGKKAAYSNGGSVYMYDTATGTSTVVLPGTAGGVRYRDAVMSADGNHIVADYDDGVAPIHYSLDFDGLYWKDLISGESRIIGNPATYADNKLISDNGSRLFYQTEYTGVRDEYGWFSLALMTTCPINCTDGPVEENPVERVTWEASGGTFRQQIKLGSALKVGAWGAAQGMARAKVVYDEYAADRSSIQEKELWITLVQNAQAPGKYEGELPLSEGITQIRSITAEITDSLGRTASRNADRLPAKITGGAALTVTAAEPAFLMGSRLAAWSPSLKVGGQIAVTGAGEWRLALPESSDYRITLLSSKGDLLAEIPAVSLKAGLWNREVMTVPVPAFLDTEILNEKGEPVSFVEVTVLGNGGTEINGAGYTDVSGKARIKAGHIGDEVKIKLGVPRPYYLSEQEILVLGPVNELKRTAVIRFGTLTGTVTGPDGKPAAGAIVQAYSSNFSLQEAQTGPDGRYSLRVPEGETKVYGGQFGKIGGMSLAAPMSVYVPPMEEKVLDLSVYPTVSGSIKFTMSEQMIGREPIRIELNKIKEFHTLRMQNEGGAFLDYSIQGEDTLLFRGIAGKYVTVCAEDRSGRVDKDCVQIPLDEHHSGTADLVLKEKSAVEGTLTWEPGKNVTYVSGTLMKLDGEGRLERTAWKQSVSKGPFRLGIAEPGSYELRLEGEGLGASVFFEAASGQISQVGEIRLDSIGRFKSSPGNRLEALTSEASKGGRVMLRGLYRNNREPINDAALQLLVPKGAALIAGSVMLNGRPVGEEQLKPIGSRGFEVPLGTLASNAEGTVSYALLVNETHGEFFEAELAIRYPQGSEITESVGQTRIPTADVTLHAPALVTKKKITVDGIAPPGSQITIFSGDTMIGEASASPTGTWIAAVTLGENSEDGLFGIRAQAVKGQEAFLSPLVLIKYDANAPHPKEITLINNRHGFDIMEMKADLTSGVARFPFILNPRTPLEAGITFDQPHRVENVRLHIADETIPLEYNSVLNRFVGIKTTEHWNLGGIWVSYDVKKDYVAGPEPTPQDIIERLPADLRELQGTVTQIEQTALRSAGATGAINVASVTVASEKYPDEKIDVDYYYEPLPGYKPNPLPPGSPPVYDFDYRFNPADGTLNISAVVPVSQAAGLLPKSARKEVIALAAEVEAVVRIGANFKFEIKTPGSGSALGLAGAVMNGYEFNSKMNAMEGLLDQVMGAGCLPPHYSQYYADRMKDMADSLLRDLMTKYALQVGGIALAGSGIGLIGGVAVVATSMAIGMRLDSVWEQQFKDLQQEFQADQANQDCEEKEDHNQDSPRTPPQDPRTPPNRERRDPDADPRWLYDPSGYVFEAVPSNRVPGVTATVMEKQADGAWKAWAADWFLQKNPLISGGEGQYGWDVPEGEWQVVYEKEGYVTAKSAVLKVLPPHFDVNVGLVSYAAPKVDWVWAENGRASLRMNFSKYMLPESVTSEAVQVTDAVKNSIVTGQIEAVDPESDTSGRQLSKSFRFIPNAPLQAGAVYKVQIDSMALSYAGVPMLEAYSGEVKVEAIAVQEAASQPSVLPGTSGMAVYWQETSYPWVDHFLLRWTKKGEPSQTGEVKAVPGSGSAVIAGLEPNTGYDFRLMTVSVDGGVSPGLPVEGRTAAVYKPAVETTPPAEATGAAAKVEKNNLTVTWTDPADHDLRHMHLRLKAPGTAGFSEPVRVEAGKGAYIYEGLTIQGSYTVRLSSVDIRGNESAGVELQANLTLPGGTPSGPASSGYSGGVPAPNPDIAVVKVEKEREDYSVFDGVASLQIKKGSLATGSEIKLTRNQGSNIVLKPNYKLFSSLITLESEQMPAGTIGLEIAYNRNSLQGIDPRRLGIYRLDPSSSTGWIYIGGVADAAKGKIRTNLSTWGTYAVLLYDQSFPDLSGHWSRQELEVLISRHLLGGKTDVKYEPDTPLTRAETSKIVLELLKASGRTVPVSGEVAPEFRDVKKGDWHYEVVTAAAKAGIVEGANGLFRPNDPVTREELAVMLLRGFKQLPDNSSTGDPLSGFGDRGSISPWAEASLQAAIRSGLINGITDTELSPGGITTRAQAGVIALRLLSQLGFIEIK